MLSEIITAVKLNRTMKSITYIALAFLLLFVCLIATYFHIPLWTITVGWMVSAALTIILLAVHVGREEDGTFTILEPHHRVILYGSVLVSVVMGPLALLAMMMGRADWKQRYGETE